ncbi:acylase [Steroidobacter sp.]|uniref:acylase n=1 Tax=Steroidobacter sp. TaxID=1978227 RepID=UPI001A50A5FF|nr:acylase [Steroidobacter sp.]MBL8266349.1 acylase [Steroidobacter sp.]
MTKITNKLMWVGVAISMALGLTACRNQEPSKASTYAAEIRRTSFGIPHIVAKDEAGIGYGFGYAYAQDNFCMFAEMLVTVNGDRSRYFGPDQTDGPDVETGSIKLTNLQSDFFFKMLNAPEQVTRSWQHQNAESQALVRGFTAGFNRYLADTPAEQQPAQCRGAPWVRKISEQDIMRLARRLASEGPFMQLMPALLAVQPPDSNREPMAHFDVDLRYASREWLGSNGVALGKEATENGRGLLFGNPHYPWFGSLRFYQLHLTIPGKLDVMGVTFGGFPVVRSGFNRDVAWTHTVNTSGHVVFYALTLDPQDPTKYVVDGQTKAMTRETVTVDVKGADGAISKRTHDFWRTDFGLIVQLPGKLQWGDGKAYALFSPSLDNHRMIETWYAMDRASSLDGLQSAMTEHVGIPWTNTIAADADGNTLYANVSVVPRVTQAKEAACIAEPYKKLIDEKLWVLTASAACQLESEPGGLQPGIFAGSELPVLRRTDFVQNSNESAWLANPAQPLTGFPSIVAAKDYPQNGRTRLGITQIQARLAGKDGLEGNRFNMRKLQQIAFNNHSYLGNLLRDDLRTVCSDTRPVVLDGKSVSVAEACAVIAKWDGKANLDSIGVFLAMKWIRGFAMEGGTVAKDIWAVPFSAQDPVNTPRGIKLRDPATLAKMRAALARAVLEAQAAGIDPAKPWGEIQIADFGGRLTPMHGADSADVYNLIRGDARDGNLRVRFGSSYIQVVQFEDDGPRVEAFLTYSQSTDPASPHFSDQTPRFGELGWIPLPFTEAQIKADPEYRSTKLEE